ncbi:hypothetical protein MMC28_001736 [Mycoblastus sanguinarius]|nr:hypothetical protein [Mycoblastus sanguinarius]
MSRRPKKRRSTGRVYETESNIKQVRFPAPRHTVKAKQQSWSAPSKYQQTITQMDPFHAIFHPRPEDENLEYDEDDEDAGDTFQASPVKKRLKVSPQEMPISKIMTRSARRQAVEAKPRSQDDEGQTAPRSIQRTAKFLQFKTPAALMPPPKTPRSFRGKEIPSSQSPDTPLSTQSRKSLRDYSRSPLKERSTNIFTGILSARKRSCQANLGEVANSTENEEEESQISTKASSIVKPITFDSWSKENSAEGRCSQRSKNTAIIGFTKEVSDPSHLQELKEALDLRSPSRGHRERGILNSDNVETAHEEDFHVGQNTQAATIGAEGTPVGSNQQHEAKPVDYGSSATGTEYAAALSKGMERGYSTAVNYPASDPNEQRDRIFVSKAESLLVDNPNLSDPITLSTPHKHRSESDEASVQLHTDLRHATQPVLQTESQFEDAWHPYAPTPELDPSNLLSSPTSNTDHDSSLPMTVPTQLLPPIRTPLANNTTPFKTLVPPSQATTVDVTQPSPRRMTASDQSYSSSPPPMPPPSSSPSLGRKVTDPWMGYEWDGVRLTDSQLLPESLMNDSFIGPPGDLGLSQEDLDEEC